MAGVGIKIDGNGRRSGRAARTAASGIRDRYCICAIGGLAAMGASIFEDF